MRTKKITKTAEKFITSIREITDFTEAIKNAAATDKHISSAYDLAVILLYREFEIFMFECLVALLNNDSQALSEKTGIAFPKHMTVPVCQHLVLEGGNYFNFSGRDGLISKLNNFLLKDHWLVQIVSEKNVRSERRRFVRPLNQLSALRNFAAHNSIDSRNKALKAVQRERIGSAGSWLKTDGRFEIIAEKMEELVADIKQGAVDKGL